MKKEKEQIFGLSIFLFAQNLWCAVMQNDDLYSTLCTAFAPYIIHRRWQAKGLQQKASLYQREVWRECKYNRQCYLSSMELNLPRIATQSILGLNRRRLGIVNEFALLSTCTIFLCYTEQLSSLNTDRTADIGKSLYSHLFKEQIFGLSIFLFAQNLWCAVMQNDDLYSTLCTAFAPYIIHRRWQAKGLQQKASLYQREVWRECKYNRQRRLFKSKHWAYWSNLVHKIGAID